MGVVKFKTNGRVIPIIPLSKHNDFIFENDELAFLPGQLREIADLHNYGMTVPEIAELERRTKKEILLALIELAYQEKITRPLAFLPEGYSEISNERYLI